VIRRVVYDTMVFYQWAVLPEGRLHGTGRAVVDGTVRLCISAELMSEVRDLLTRPAIAARSPNLTRHRVEQFLDNITRLAEVHNALPRAFTWPQHPDDDHLFNLAVAAKANYLVTWENRILQLPKGRSAAAKLLREVAPQLSIVTPAQLSKLVNASESSDA